MKSDSFHFLKTIRESKMKKDLIGVILTLALLAAATAVASADEVTLKNGDRISGEVVAMENNKLVIKTSYAGEIFITWSQVEKISIDKPVEVVLSDNASLKGVIQTTEDGHSAIVLDKTQERVDLKLAEVNKINAEPAESSELNLNIRANIGIQVESGNTDKQKYHFDGRAIARKGRHRLSFGFEYDHEYNDNRKTKNKLLASSKMDYFFQYPWYIYGKGAYEFDEFKDLNLKLDLGPGLGYQIFESELINLSLEAGPSYVRQDFKNERTRDYIAARSAMEFDKYFFEKFFQFFLLAEGFSNPEESDDRFARLRTGLRFPLEWGLNLTTQYNLDWDSNPPEGIDDTDQKFIFLVGYEY